MVMIYWPRPGRLTCDPGKAAGRKEAQVFLESDERSSSYIYTAIRCN